MHSKRVFFNCRVFFILFLLASCGPGKLVQLKITQPAAITFPSEANKLLLVDRTKPDSRALNLLEGLISGEMLGEDYFAVTEAIEELDNELSFSPRFKSEIYPERLTGNSLSKKFPEPLAWLEVEEMCNDRKADVMICVEVFDTDFIVKKGSRNKKRTEGSGKNAKEVEYKEYFAERKGNLMMGFRIYLPKSSSILDEQIFMESMSWEAVGNSAIDAELQLINKMAARKKLASLVASNYAYKISPMPVLVSRKMYSKSRRTPGLEIGCLSVEAGKWSEAIENWTKGIAYSTPKEAGKLAYNIAIGYEVLGDVEQALLWASDAYTRYGNSFAKNYAAVLEKRIQEKNLLKQQMGEKK